MALVVKNLPANSGDIRDASWIPGLGVPSKEGMAIHSSILAWRIPWTRSLVGYSPWDHRESHTNELCWMHCCANLKALAFNCAIMEMRKNQTAGSKRKRSFENQLWTRSGSQRWVWLWIVRRAQLRVWGMNLFIKHFVWRTLMTFSKASYPKWG